MDDFDKSFDELIEKGYIKADGTDQNGEVQYILTDKANNLQEIDDLINKKRPH